MFRRRFFVLLIVAALAACGGGGGGTSSGIPAGGGGNAPGAASFAQAPVTMAITVPKGSSSASTARRAPKYVPANAQSITFTLLQSSNTAATTGTAGSPYTLTAANPACASGTAGLTCTLSLDAPVGSDVYTATVYATTNGTGTPIGSGAVALSVKQNANNAATLTLTGADATAILTTDDASSYVPPNAATSLLVLWPGSGPVINPQSGSVVPATARIFVVAQDSQGNEVISPELFATPVVLTLQWAAIPDTSGDQSPPPIALGQSGTPPAVLTVTYAFPQNGVASATTSAGSPSVAILSPADTITISPVAGFSLPQAVAVTATIGTTLQSIDLLYAVGDTSCPAGNTGTPPFNCAGPSAAPSPTPSPYPEYTPYPLSWTAVAASGSSAGSGNLNFPYPGTSYAYMDVLPGTQYAVTLSATATSALQINAGACDSGMLLGIAAGASASSATGYTLGPTTTNALTFSIFPEPAYGGPMRCTIYAFDAASDEADLVVNFNEAALTVDGRARR